MARGRAARRLLQSDKLAVRLAEACTAGLTRCDTEAKLSLRVTTGGCGVWGVGCGVWGVGRGVQTLRGVGCDHTETSIASALTLTHPMHHDHTTSNRHDAHNHRLGRSNPASLHLKNVKGARPPLPRCPGPSPIFGFSFLDAGWGWSRPRSMVAEMPRGPAPKPPCANIFQCVQKCVGNM